MLDREFQYFLDNQKVLSEKFFDKHLLISGEAVVGIFNDNAEAYDEGVKKYGLGNFLLQHCLPGQLAYTQTFHSQIIL